LEPWVEPAKIVAKRAKDTYVVTNNHFLGKAVVNAFEMVSLLFERPVVAPEHLVQRYPVLEQVSTERPAHARPP
jgi:uncharacterized protein YecE (DUF72 family)